MQKFKSFSKKLLKNRKGQGMVEYILLLVVIVGIVMLMKGKLTEYVEGNLWQALSDKMTNVISN